MQGGQGYTVHALERHQLFVERQPVRRPQASGIFADAVGHQAGRQACLQSDLLVGQALQFESVGTVGRRERIQDVANACIGTKRIGKVVAAAFI